MKQILRFTFRQQCILCAAVFLLDIVLAHLMNTGLFHNLTWLIWGVLFLLNPVTPESWSAADPNSREKGARIAGILFVVVGLIFRSGV